MKTIRCSILCFVVLLLTAPLLWAQDLSQVSALYLWNELDQSVGAY